MSGKPSSFRKVKSLPAMRRMEERAVAMRALSIAAYIAEHSPRPAGVPEGCVKIDQLDSFRNSNLVARIATLHDESKAQEELNAALQRRSVEERMASGSPPRGGSKALQRRAAG